MAQTAPPTTVGFIGFIGNGELSKRMLKGLLKDQHEAKTLTFLVPVSPDLFTAEVDTAFQFAIDNDINVEVIYGDDLDPDHADVLDAATTKHKVADIPAQMISLLAKAPDGNLFVFWDDEDEVGYSAFVAADDEGVPCYDLCNGLERLTFNDEVPDPEPEEEEPEEDEVEPGTVYDEATLLAMHIDKVKKIALDQFGFTLADRVRVKTYTAEILKRQEGGSEAPVEPVEPPGAVEVADDDEEIYTPPTEDPADTPLPEEDAPAPPVVVGGSTVGTAQNINLNASQFYGISTATKANYTSEWEPKYVPKAKPFDVVGHCLGCGGPILLSRDVDDNGVPQIAWSHALACPLHVS